MSCLRAVFVVLVSSALLMPSAFASRVHRPPTSGHSHSRSHKSAQRRVASAPRARGQQTIDSERATEIQQALIREHYLTGDPSGAWDAASVAAMQKYQADQGWQTKLMPDARALKKLGLGPDYSGAINAKSAHFVPPPPINTIPFEQASGFISASGVNQ